MGLIREAVEDWTDWAERPRWRAAWSPGTGSLAQNGTLEFGL
jgi:hypothetical protein